VSWLTPHVVQIEQFIETMYPKQTPDKAKMALDRRQGDQQNMDPKEVFLLVGMTVLIIIFMCALMVRIMVTLWKPPAVPSPTSPFPPPQTRPPSTSLLLTPFL
jgi:hypothetical protein